MENWVFNPSNLKSRISNWKIFRNVEFQFFNKIFILRFNRMVISNIEIFFVHFQIQNPGLNYCFQKSIHAFSPKFRGIVQPSYNDDTFKGLPMDVSECPKCPYIQLYFGRKPPIGTVRLMSLYSSVIISGFDLS